ncbi:hypothetical protein F2Q70_00029242 [Brassica cretica]|uniref:Uncharacterized protein n=1 Tax=Brassica cretica TaxID=69181 RepID=A0A8S9FLM2_BRACR|nr:hypothetical protein F2Q70_00029242 [Brassica cretica]KAF2551875.1 hypothetical protein F2Q68_00033615 [Brassica cretica]
MDMGLLENDGKGFGPQKVPLLGSWIMAGGQLKGHFTRADHLEIDETKNNRSMRISADDRYQEMPR